MLAASARRTRVFAEARAAAADDHHTRTRLEQISQVPPAGAVVAVEHEDVDVSSRQQPRHRSRLLMPRLMPRLLMPRLLMPRLLMDVTGAAGRLVRQRSSAEALV